MLILMPTSSVEIKPIFLLLPLIHWIAYIVEYVRNVAQPGSALFWGDRGRGFESRRSDHFWRK